MMEWSKSRADKLLDKVSTRQSVTALSFRQILHRKNQATEFLLKAAQQVLQNDWTKVTQRINRFNRKFVLRTRQRSGIVVIRREYSSVIEYQLSIFRSDVECIVRSRVTIVFHLNVILGKHRRARLGRKHV